MNELCPKEIRAHLELLERSRRPDDFRPVALHGSAPAGTVEVAGVTWAVVPVAGELQLRHELVAREGGDQATALLVDYTETLPLDVACRLRGARVHSIGLAQRLRHRFGARGLVPGLAQTAVAARALALDDGRAGLVPHVTLTADDLWRAVLADALDAAPPDSPRAWMTLAIGATDGPARTAELERTERLVDELDAWLAQPDRLGVAGALLRETWSEAGGPNLLAALLLQAAERHDDTGTRNGLRLLFRTVFDERLEDPAVVATLLPHVDALMDAVPPEAREQACVIAERHTREPLDALARHSRYLRAGRALLQDELAAALQRALEASDELQRVWTLVEQLRVHEATSDAAHALHQHAARLVTWLAWRRARPQRRTGTWSDVVELARRYDREGGHLDWCRAALRDHATSASALDLGVRAVLDAADAARRDDDRRFATALVAWHEAGCPNRDVRPIDQASRHTLKPFLEADAERRVLVVLMDGMSKAQLAQLLSDQTEWQPLVGPTKPTLAALPTLTKTSRADFFAGHHDPEHGRKSESDDVKRWRKNRWVKPFADARMGPRLFTNSHLHDTLDDELLAALADPDERVVAVIVNALDDDLSGAKQIAADLSRANIPVFDKLLELARSHKRVVLLVSDHGHVAGSQLQGRKRPPTTVDGGQRWRPLGPNEAPLDVEVELPPKVWHPTGATRAAGLWDERVMWDGAKKGAHGGLTLAEVVVPCVLLAPPFYFYDRSGADEGLRTAPVDKPPWWTGALPRVRRVHEASDAATGPQLDLLGTKEELVDEDAHHELVDALLAAPRFVACSVGRESDRDDLVRLLDAMLLGAGDGPERYLGFDRAAEVLGIRERRVRGRIPHLQYFQLDGIQLLEGDLNTRRIVLHVERLRQQYGLPG